MCTTSFQVIALFLIIITPASLAQTTTEIPTSGKTNTSKPYGGPNSEHKNSDLLSGGRNGRNGTSREKPTRNRYKTLIS